MFSGWLERDSSGAARVVRMMLPEPHAGCHPHALVRPAEFKAWLVDLPTANPLITAQKIAYQLGLLVRYPRRINRLNSLLTLIQAPMKDLAEQVDELLRQQVSGFETSLFTPLMRNFGEANRELTHVQLRLINELLDDGKMPSASFVLQTLAALAQQIRLTLATYGGTPPGTWRNMLRLFALAESLEPETDDAHTTKPAQVATDSPQNLLVGSLLYQLTDPLHLPTAQSLELYDLANTLAREARLTLTADNQHLIVVDRSGSMPPLTAARGVEAPAPQDIGYLDVTGLIETLEALPEPEVNDTLMLYTLRDLSAEFSDLQGRRHPRIPRQATYAMFVGITAIHRRLSQLTDGSNPSLLTQESIFVGAETPNIDRPQVGIACKQINFSEGGAAFELPAEQFAHGQVGDLVMFESHSADTEQRPTGLLGRIRRLLRRDAWMLEIGVEKLQWRLTPVQIKSHRGSSSALIFPGPDPAGWQLFASSDAAPPGAVLELQSSQGTVQVRVEKHLDRTQTMVHALVSRIG